MYDSTPDSISNEIMLDTTMEEYTSSCANVADNNQDKLENDDKSLAQHPNVKESDKHYDDPNGAQDDIEILEAKLSATHIIDKIKNFKNIN